MPARKPSDVAHIMPIARLTDTEALLDMVALRGYRLQRVRDQLKIGEFDACLLVDPINIRYATGSRNFTLFQMHTPARYLFVPVEGPTVLFEAEGCHHVARGLETVGELRPTIPLNYFFGGPRLPDKVKRWAAEIADLFQRPKGKRLAIDRCDPMWAVELTRHGIQLFDAQGPLEQARVIKSAEEVLCMNFAIGVAEVGMARMQEALEPGMTENELWAILHETNIALNGEWVDSRLLTSGERTNPWFQECSDRMIRPGEVVGFDTDMPGPFGYCADVSRTFFCGPGKPSDQQRELYQLAYEEIHHNLELVKPGLSFKEFTEKAYKPKPEFVANRYMIICHGIGMCDEYPAIFYPQDYEREGYDGIIEENMTLCIESYMGPEGGHQGVKLEQQVLVGSNGPLVLTKYPFAEEFLR
jgi:Xaa-Pro dipeptidase